MFLQVKGDIWLIKMKEPKEEGMAGEASNQRMRASPINHLGDPEQNFDAERGEQFFLLDVDSKKIYHVEKGFGSLIEGSMDGKTLEEVANLKLGIFGDENLKRIYNAILQYPFFSIGDSPFSFPKRKEGLDERLDFMWLELTPKCNLNCIHCYISSGVDADRSYSSLLSKEYWKRVLEEGIELNCRRVQFTGGEATLHPDLLPLLRFARKIGYETIELFTNSTILTKDMIDEFKKIGVSVASSFYSSKPDTHDKITKKNGSWRKTVENVKTLVSEGIPLRVGVILMEENRTHYEKTSDFLKKLGVKKVGYDYVRPTGRGKDLTSSHDSSWEEASLIPLSYDGIFRRKIVIAPDGGVYPCILTRDISMGNVHDTPLGDIVFSKERLNCVGCSFVFLRNGRRFYAKPQPWWNPKRRVQLQKRPNRMKEIFSEEIEEELVVYNPLRGEVHILNPIAASIFDLCDGKHTAEEIAEEISSLTGADFKKVLSDVSKTVEEFQEKGLLEEDNNLTVSGLL